MTLTVARTPLAAALAELPEEWRPIPGAPDYEASDLGRVRSNARMLGKTIRGKRCRPFLFRGRVLRQSLSSTRGGRKPYCQVRIILNGGWKCVRVHRLVLMAFVGPCPPGMEGCHNDGSTTNSHLANLRWDTPVANRHDRKKHGTDTDPPLRFGSDHHMVKLSFDDVREIWRLYAEEGLTLKLIAKRFGSCKQTISNYVNFKLRVAA